MTFDDTGAIFTSLVTAPSQPPRRPNLMRCFPGQPIKLGDLLSAKVVISLSVSGFFPAAPSRPPQPL